MAARRLIESGQPLMVSTTVVLELEWVMQGYYGFSQPEVAIVLRHLLGLHHVTIEAREVIEQALQNGEPGSTSQMRCTTRATRPAKASRRSTTESSLAEPESLA